METLLIMITVMVIGYFVQVNTKKELINNQDKNEFTVRLSKIYVWIGIIDSILFLSIFVLMLIYPNNTGGFWVGVVFVGFILLGLTLVNVGLAWKVKVINNRDFFVYRTFFWRTFEVHYSDITKVDEVPFYLYLKCGKNSFFIDKSAYNFELFNALLEKKRIVGQMTSDLNPKNFNNIDNAGENMKNKIKDSRLFLILSIFTFIIGIIAYFTSHFVLLIYMSILFIIDVILLLRALKKEQRNN